jgi:hypothetical protein
MNDEDDLTENLGRKLKMGKVPEKAITGLVFTVQITETINLPLKYYSFKQTVVSALSALLEGLRSGDYGSQPHEVFEVQGRPEVILEIHGGVVLDPTRIPKEVLADVTLDGVDNEDLDVFGQPEMTIETHGGAVLDLDGLDEGEEDESPDVFFVITPETSGTQH